ncbi:DMT family transporter [Amycolatopsis japonica]|uniref:DMT family transporter n=1 Tax=Amycolatopsis japonica TaxID=208439 RepID=UPI003319EBAF
MFQRVALSAGCAAVTAWATNAVVADSALTSMNVAQFLALEFAAASAVLAVATVIQGSVVTDGDGRRMAPARAIRLRLRLVPFVLGVVGVVGTVGFQAAAFASAPVVTANLLAYSWPLLVGLWTVITVRMSRPWLYMSIILIGLGGVWLMLDRGTTDQATCGAWGYLFAAGSALCMACFTIAAAHTRLSIAGSLLPAVATGAAAFSIVAVATSMPWPPWTDLLHPLYLGCIPMAAGYTLWAYASARGQPATIATLGYLTPALSTTLLVIIDPREIPSGHELVGIALVLTCVATTAYLTRRSRYLPD